MSRRVVDPLDGTANAAAGVPVCAFAAAVVADDVVEAARILWFDAASHQLAHEAVSLVLDGRQGAGGAVASGAGTRARYRRAS